MEKPADNSYPIIDVIKRRWSPRSFADRTIEPQKIRQLFEAVRWSASAFNEQPWRFVIATRDNEAQYSKALSCLVEANQVWAKLAPLLILTFTKKTFTQNDKPNRVYMHDLGLAMTNLCLQATAMGLFVHQMAGVDVDKMRSTYKVPEDFEPMTAAAVGYAGDVGLLPEQLRGPEQEPRTRKALNEFVFTGKFGDAAGVVTP
jgi:nitroreductase